MDNKRLSERKIAGIAACVTCLLYGSGLLVIFTPFPLYFVSILYGKSVRAKTVIFSVVAALAIYMLVVPLLYGLGDQGAVAKLVFLIPGTGLAEFFNVGSVQYFGVLYLSYFLMLGWVFGEGTIKKWSLSKWFATSVGATFAFLVIAFLILAVFGVDIFGGLHKYMSTMLSELVAAQESAGIGPQRIFAIKQNAKEIVDFSISIIPSVIFILGLMVAFVNYALARWLVKVPSKFAHFGETTHYSLPHYFVWITIALGFFFFFERYVLHFNLLRYLSVNGLIAVGGVYFLQGLLIVAFFMRKLRARLFKALIYLTMFMFIQVVAPIIIILGLTDLWIDFRKLVRKEIANKRSVPWK